jgi:hypothetical protein
MFGNDASMAKQLMFTRFHSFNQWEFPEPKFEVPTIYKAYFSSLSKGISPQNMAKHMVLTYLHKLDPGIPIDNMPILWGPSHTKPVPKSLHWVGALSRAVPSAKLKKIACFGKGLLFCDKGSSGLSLKVAGWVNHEH